MFCRKKIAITVATVVLVAFSMSVAPVVAADGPEPAAPKAKPTAKPDQKAEAKPAAQSPLAQLPVVQLIGQLINAKDAHKALLEKLSEAMRVALNMLSGNQANLLSGNAPKLLSENSPALLSGNSPKLLSENETPILSGNRVEAKQLSENNTHLLSGNTSKLLSDNKTPVLSGNKISLFSDIKVEINMENIGNNNRQGGPAANGRGPAGQAANPGAPRGTNASVPGTFLPNIQPNQPAGMTIVPNNPPTPVPGGPRPPQGPANPAPTAGPRGDGPQPPANIPPQRLERLRQRFQQMDTNNDGVLTFDEFLRAQEQPQ
jgi:hypothetical protein